MLIHLESEIQHRHPQQAGNRLHASVNFRPTRGPRPPDEELHPHLPTRRWHGRMVLEGAVDVREGWETRANTNPCKPSWCHNVNRHDQLTAHRLEKAGISPMVEIGNQHWLPFPPFFWDAHDLAGRGRTVIPRHTTTTVAVAGSAHHLEARAGPMLLGIQESRPWILCAAL